MVADQAAAIKQLELKLNSATQYNRLYNVKIDSLAPVTNEKRPDVVREVVVKSWLSTVFPRVGI